MTIEAKPPLVSAVVPTRDRPELVRQAVRSVLAQDYAGDVEVLVIFDGTEPEPELAEDTDPQRVRLLVNTRAEGLAGARNTGILSARGHFVAFLDDDDAWEPSKLSKQISGLLAEPDAEFSATSMAVDFQGGIAVRLTGSERVSHEQLLRSRMAMLHSSSFVLRRAAMLDGLGLVDERAPGSMCEDWDILLRASSRHQLLVVDEPLVRVLWGRTSFFAQRWEIKIAAHRWMLAKHPDILTNRIGAGRVYGQLAFSHAALRRRRAAAGYALRSLRCNWREPRAGLAIAVSIGLVSADRVLAVLHRRGHGI